MAPSTTDAQGCVSLAEKVAFLSDPAAYPGVSGEVEAIETHMSWVFVVGELAFKLKKPVRFPYLDFSTLAGRGTDCRAELTLNRRLAPDVYLRVAPLVLTGATLKLDGEGEVGITAPDGRRAVSSADALYPLELYIACGDVGGLASGVYRFNNLTAP